MLQGTLAMIYHYLTMSIYTFTYVLYMYVLVYSRERRTKNLAQNECITSSAPLTALLSLARDG